MRPTVTAISAVRNVSPSPYRPGAVSRFLAWVDGLPWHGWWVFPALLGLLFAWSQGIAWASGQVPVGTIQPFLLSGVIYAPYTLAALAWINRSAERALVSFWPATGWPDDAREAWRYAFVNSPGGYTAISFGLGIAAAIGAFLAAPGDVVGAGADRVITFVAYLPAAALGYSLVTVALIHTSRQLRLVARIHREARHIDPFDRVPVYAFSYMTARTGLAYILSGYYAITVNGSFQAGNPIGNITVAATLGFGIACFVLPLWGIHGRLGREKEALLGEVERRLSRLGEEMYRRVDAAEFDGTKVVSEALAGVLALRERIVRLPTWPWAPQLFRGFLSALFLPVIVYVLSRLIGGRIGA
jgi:hypothetical protein